MLKIAMGHSENLDTQAAIKEVLQECSHSLKGVEPQAGVLFASVSYDFPKILAEIKKNFPYIHLVGCSSFGEISTKFGLSLNSISLLVFHSDKIQFGTGMVKKLGENAVALTVKGAKEVLSNLSKKPSFCCLFADCLAVNIVEVISGLNQAFGKDNFPIAGGSAADDWTFEQVYVFSEKEVTSNSAAFLIFSEPLKTSIAVRHGKSYIPSSRKNKVTKSSTNIVYTINNISALDFYKETLGENDKFYDYSLIIYLDDPDKFPDKYIVRNPIHINPSNGSITFPGEVPENSYVGISQLSTQTNTLEAARECAKKAYQEFTGKKIEAALVFSCCMRKEFLGSETKRELDIIAKELPKDLPLFGFYTYGEIGSFNPGDPIHFFNETVVVALIGE